jgi:hypothetical protein
VFSRLRQISGGIVTVKNKNFQMVWKAKVVFLCFVVSSLTSCEKSLNYRLEAEPISSIETFELAQGLKLEYPLYMPNSLVGWNIDPSTRFLFDEKRMVYFLDKIPLSSKDPKGQRLKICTDAWLNQFGFGTVIPYAETTIGIPSEGVVVRVEKFAQPAAEIHIETPRTEAENSQTLFLHVELKLIRGEPNPLGLLYLRTSSGITQ